MSSHIEFNASKSSANDIEGAWGTSASIKESLNWPARVIVRVGRCSARDGDETKGEVGMELKEAVVQAGSLSRDVCDKQLALAVESLVGTKHGATWSEQSWKCAGTTGADGHIPWLEAPWYVAGRLRQSTSVLSFKLASSSPCFMRCYGNEENMIIKPLNITAIHEYIPGLGLMSLLPFLPQSFPLFPSSGRDISSQ